MASILPQTHVNGNLLSGIRASPTGRFRAAKNELHGKKRKAFRHEATYNSHYGKRSDEQVEWAALGLLALLWGGSFFFVSIAVRELPPLSIVAVRTGLAAVALIALMAAARALPPLRADVLRTFLVMGALNNALPFVLIVWGQTRIAGGLAAILNASTPVFSVIVAHMAGRERATPARLAGVLAGAAGVACIIGGDALAGLGDDIPAQLAVLGAGLSYSFAALAGMRLRELGVQPLAAAGGQVSAATLLLLPLVLWIDRPWSLPPPSPETWAALAALALLSTALAYVLYFRILSSSGATNVLLVTFLVPVSAIILGAAFLDERLRLAHFAGMALIGLGLAAVDGRPLRWLRR